MALVSPRNTRRCHPGVDFGVLSEIPVHIGEEDHSKLSVGNNTVKGKERNLQINVGILSRLPGGFGGLLKVLGKPLWQESKEFELLLK